jgi:hypothetical protein
MQFLDKLGSREPTEEDEKSHCTVIPLLHKSHGSQATRTFRGDKFTVSQSIRYQSIIFRKPSRIARLTASSQKSTKPLGNKNNTAQKKKKKWDCLLQTTIPQKQLKPGQQTPSLLPWSHQRRHTHSHSCSPKPVVCPSSYPLDKNILLTSPLLTLQTETTATTHNAFQQ